MQKFQLENEVADLQREATAYQDLLRALRSERDQAALEAERNARIAAEYQTLADSNAARATEIISSTRPSPTALAEAESLRNLAQSQRRSAEDALVVASGHRAAVAEYDRLLAERQQQLIYLLGQDGALSGACRRSRTRPGDI